MELLTPKYFKILYADGSSSVFKKTNDNRFDLKVTLDKNGQPHTTNKYSGFWDADQMAITLNGSLTNDVKPKIIEVIEPELFLLLL